ncbi:MAG: coproporphyrinogen dehydrogenase HemZ [Bacillota bacterium]
MVKILCEDVNIKTHDPYELVRAFYSEEEVQVVDDRTFITEEKDEDAVRISMDNNIYRVSLLRGNEIVDTEEIPYSKLDFYRNERASRNNTVKHLIYKVLDRNLKTNLPWGILTGTRPVKIAKILMDKGLDIDETLDTLTEAYLLRPDKARLIIQVSIGQKKILESIEKNSYSIYIGIPFCPTRCFYCSFPTLNADKYGSSMERYVENLIHELEDNASMMEKWAINTIYIGGGTPTSLPVELMERLLKYIDKKFIGVNELTVEAGRPDTINSEYLELFKRYNVDRISINPQTMNDDTLKIIGRRHSSEDILTTYKLSKDIGIETVNMDLIVGLPSEDRKDIEDTLKKLEPLQPDNLTVHTLAVKKGSDFIDDRKNYSMASAEEIQEMLRLTAKYAEKNNLIPYYLYRQKQIMGNFENIGYSRPDNPCLYNISIMEEKETIIGIGMGSTTKLYNKLEDSIETIANFRNLKEYMDRLSELELRKRQKIKGIEDSWSQIQLDT